MLRAAPNQPSAWLVARTDRRFALSEAGQFPNARSRRIDVGGDVDVDQIRLVRGNAAPHSLGQVRGPIDADAFDARGARHGGKVGIVTLAGFRMVEVRGQLAAAECMKKAPSPHTDTQGRSGAANLAPKTPATPKPMGPKPIEPINESGRRGLQ